MVRYIILILLAALIFILGVFIYFNFFSGVGDFGGNRDSDQINEDRFNQGEVEIGEKNFGISGQIAGDVAGSADGRVGSAGEAAESDTGGCEERQIAYALRNFNEEEVCDEFNGEVCIRKRMICRVEIDNLDDNTEGIFSIKFYFFADTNLIDSKIVGDFVGANEFKIFESILDLDDSNGLANKDISCSFNSEKVPKEEVC